MKQWLYGVGAAVMLTACAPGAGTQPPQSNAGYVAEVRVAEAARALQAVAVNWTASDVDHYAVTLEVFMASAPLLVGDGAQRISEGSFGPLSPARTARVTPGGTASFSSLVGGKLYRASVVAVGGDDNATVISSPAYAEFDFRAANAPNSLTAAATPVFLPVAFSGDWTVTPEAPATNGIWSDPTQAESVATGTADVVASPTLQ